LTGLCARKNESWVFNESGGNGIGKKAQTKVETPTEKGINRTSNQQEKKSRRLGQVLGEGGGEHKGKLRAPHKNKSTEMQSRRHGRGGSCCYIRKIQVKTYDF